MTQSVGLFIDYQNMYEDARAAYFQEGDLHVRGQFNPWELGELIASKQPIGSDDEREIKLVRLYTGIANPRKDPKTHAARERQINVWRKNNVDVIGRSLKYPRNWPDDPAYEKGVDVALAVDCVVSAIEGECDVAVVASTDTDLRPALRFVAERENIEIEVAAWWNGIQKQLSRPGEGIWCHRLSQDDYDLVSDTTNYSRSAR